MILNVLLALAFPLYLSFPFLSSTIDSPRHRAKIIDSLGIDKGKTFTGSATSTTTTAKTTSLPLRQYNKHTHDDGRGSTIRVGRKSSPSPIRPVLIKCVTASAAAHLSLRTSENITLTFPLSTYEQKTDTDRVSVNKMNRLHLVSRYNRSFANDNAMHAAKSV